MKRPITKTNVHAAPAHAVPCFLPTVTWTMGGGTGGIRCDVLLTSADYGEGEAFPGDNSSKEPAYNSFGALVSDGGREITSVSYDSFGNPVRILCSGNRSVTNVYSATGEKLKTVHALNVAAQAAMSLVPDVECASVLADGTDVVGGADSSTTEYHGSLVYRDGRLDMVLFPGGYATVSGASVTFHYYTRDYLGNNRAVINGSTGALEQTVAYYPYGGVIPDISTNPTTVQPYKFGGKELITANGLNEYDFGARMYYSAVPGFTKPDPMCEKYSWLSPYLYCANNPVNLTDPTGMFIVGESRQEWNRNRNDIEKRRDGLQKSIDNIKAKGARKGWSQDRMDRKIGDRQERVASLDNTLSTMTTLENSEQGYSISSKLSNRGETFLKNDGIIEIKYHKGNVALFCHEVTHAGQFETGDIAFIKGSEGSYLNDVYDEAAAFQAQYAYDPNTVNGLNPNMAVSSLADISPEYVLGIRDSNGMSYAPGGANNVGSVMVRIDSPVERLLHAFPNHIGYINFVNSHRYIKQLPNIYYKK